MFADTVIISDNVFTATDENVHPLAIIINDTRIEAVVDKADVQAMEGFIGPDTQVLDFGDAFICPGFHDAHQHVMHAALFPSRLADEYLGESEEDCVEHMVGFAESRPGSGWLLSHGWRDNLWTPAKAPTKASLDARFPDRPVCMYSGDSHTLWLNSCGLEALGLSDDSQPMPGGIYDRDEEGHLTGVIREAAGMKFISQILKSFSDEELKAAYAAYFRKLLSLGITSVCDMAISLIPGADCILPEIYESLEEEGRLDVRCHIFPTLSEDESNLEDLERRLTGGMLRAPGFKQFFDGVSSQHTAWETEEYENPRFPGDRGRPTVAPERMRSLVMEAARRGHATRIHAIGDAAVHEALDIFQEAYDMHGCPGQGANTLEHIEDIQPADIQRMKEAHVVASVQPPHVTIDITQPDRDLGTWRARRMWPFRSFVEAGIPVALGTDAPVVPPCSMDVLWCAIWRSNPATHLPEGGWYPQEDLTRAQAIRAYTHGSACAVGREDELGTIEVDKYADLVVLDQNLLEVDKERFQDTGVIATFIGGKQAYRKED